MSIIQKCYNLISGTLLFTSPMWGFIGIFSYTHNLPVSVLTVLLGSTFIVSIAFQEHNQEK